MFRLPLFVNFVHSYKIEGMELNIAPNSLTYSKDPTSNKEPETLEINYYVSNEWHSWLCHFRFKNVECLRYIQIWSLCWGQYLLSGELNHKIFCESIGSTNHLNKFFVKIALLLISFSTIYYPKKCSPDSHEQQIT